ncbi:MAG: hypothetical protein K2W84_03225 [Burkholderiales bacterium]|nr:hypothetical protein [Burkholderiales bacterium]
MPVEIVLLSMLLALVQVALYLFLGRGAMWVFGGNNRDKNFIYQLFKKGTDPLIKATRLITPKFVLDKHLPFVTILLLVWIGLAVIHFRRGACLAHQLAC